MYEKDELEDVELEEEETSEEDIESVQETKKAKSKKETITLDFSMNAIERLQIEIDFTDGEYQKVVGRYLLKEFEKDEELRLAYFTKKITLEQVWKHIYEYAKAQTKKPGNSNCVCLSDEEVFGQAVHFIQDGAPIKEYKDNKVTLSKEVKKSLEEQAKEEYLAEQKRKLEEAEKKRLEKEKAAKAKALEKEKEEREKSGQITLFDDFDWGDQL